MHKTSSVLLLVLGLSGCGARGAPEAPPPPAAAHAPAAPPAAPPAPAADPALARLTLVERLEHEAAARPDGTPRADEVRAAAAAQGFAVESWTQVLGSPVGARFCMAGQTAQGVGLAVCEFASAAEAAAGLAYSRATFDRLIPNRELSVNRKTLLTLTRATAAPALAAGARKLAQIFAAL